jgi:hypothetical protein
MPVAKRERLLGVPDVAIDPKTRQVQFALKLDNLPDRVFVADVSVIEQIASALASSLHSMNERASPLKAAPVVAQPVAQYLVRKDPHSDTVLLRIVTQDGVPHTFAIPSAHVGGIADRLRIEGDKDTSVGNA